ncbi:KR domain-containing protein [Desarmillaria tabescens]|uniref:KR domain-containing protein n=1 Tax=Armillaria tabescens TaxID=1929756 RepID=A0AA39TRZ5_ARMTA|nr:KR domain-containing protein [Desarmillaria tabescens]KAK0461849.1 KR domain-containing protein [Desarmillaria tabescens]
MNERQIFCDYSTAGKGQTSSDDDDSCSCRTVELDLDSAVKDQHVPRYFYDIIIGISSEMSSSRIAVLHDLLIPGGIVIVIILNDIKGQLPREQDSWRASVGKHFRSSNVLASCRYFIIEAQKQTLQLPEIRDNGYEKKGPPMLSFRLGGELGIRNEILQLQSSGTAVIWIESTTDVSGAAARGFCRSLRREILGTNVRLVLFNETWLTRERSVYIGWLSSVDGLENESEFLVERNGQLLLPRLVHSLSFETPQDPSIDSIRYWTATATESIAASPCPRVPPNHVLLSISLTSEPDGNVRGLYGRIIDAGDTQWHIHSYVTAIACGPLSNFAIVHTGQVLAPRWKDQLGALVPIFIASSYLGFGSLKDRRRVQNRRAVLLFGNEDRSCLPERLTRVFEYFGMSTIVVVGAAPQLLELLKPGDLVLSNYNEHHKSIRSICDFVGASLYLWDDPVNGILEEIKRNPWTVSDIFDILLDTNFPPSVLSGSFQTPSDLVAARAIKFCLFREDVFYLLHGGIGSLGLQVALWMYQKGARKIVLTSRTGGQALSRKNPASFNLLTYLSEQQDLELRLECCDASSLSDMQRLMSNLPGRIGGCILLSVILEDRSYVNHTSETYNRVFPAKTEAFTVLEKTIAIEQLEFLVTVSSAAIFGSAGQTNYSSANTAVDFMIRRYPNAFALVAPAIIDSDTVIDPNTLLPRPSLEPWAPWAMTSRHLCACLEDGLERMRNQAFWLYIPDYSWSEFQKFCGPSSLYDHLIPMPSKTVVESQNQQGVLSQIERLVCDSLGLSIEELSPDVPLTAYGLDSLSASRLSVSLRHFLPITQLQLLGDISLRDILTLIRRTTNPIKDNRKLFDWRKLNLPGETVVKLVDTEGIPLVIIHGASGIILAFKGMQEVFDTPLYACQITPDTPVSSLQSMALFYFQKIKLAVPNGPYRLAGYCGTCLLTLEIARNFESNGDEIVQLAFVDYSPALYTSPILWEFDAPSLQNKVASIPLVNKLLDIMLTLYEISTSKTHLDIARDLRKVAAGHVERELMMSYYQIFGDICRTITRFLIELGETNGAFSYHTLQVELTTLVKSIKACSIMTVFVASHGMIQSLGQPSDEWKDLGCRSIVPEAQVIFVESDHITVLDQVADRLQREWRNV